MQEIPSKSDIICERRNKVYVKDQTPSFMHKKRYHFFFKSWDTGKKGMNMESL